MDINLKEDLEKIEGVIVWDENVELQKILKKHIVVVFSSKFEFF